MLQKTTELGVNVIIPLVSKYSVIKIKKSNERLKKDHWEKIARSACEQCGRNFIPEIQNPRLLDKFINEKNSNFKIILDPTSSKTFNEINPQDRNIDILIGPEGGFNNKEIEAADRNKFVRVSMGPRILRAETAAISAISIIQSLWGDMSADFPFKKR
jgi:16S rRNA (uracil1498-N3)-methyltransferase